MGLGSGSFLSNSLVLSSSLVWVVVAGEAIIPITQRDYVKLLNPFVRDSDTEGRWMK